MWFVVECHWGSVALGGASLVGLENMGRVVVVDIVDVVGSAFVVESVVETALGWCTLDVVVFCSCLVVALCRVLV
jgi:hypothetical protein